MTIMSRCSDCKNEHPLSRRELFEENLTTSCPKCESTSYETYYEDIVIEEEAEAIRNSVEDIAGVGEKVIESIISSYSTKEALDSATVKELEEVEYVGKTVAERIVESL